MSPTATRRRQRGQALPIGLAFLVAALLLGGLGMRVGARMIQQERVRMRSDLTAYSGGIQMARCLNILCYSEKIRLAGEVIGYIPIVSAVGAGMEKLAAAFQKLFIPAAPWAVEADVVFMGQANEIDAVPLWNEADALGGLSMSRLKPDLRVKAANSGDSGSSSSDGKGSASGAQGGGQSDQASGDSVDLGRMATLLKGFSRGGDDSEAGDSPTTDGSAYHYQSGDGQRHDLDQDQAGAVDERGPHGSTVTRYKDNSTHKYVAKGKKTSHGYGMTDQGPHYLAVLAFQPGDDQQPWARPALAVGCAQVRVAGGNVNAFDLLHGANYAPFFAPVRGGSDQQGQSGADTLGQALDWARQLGINTGGLGRTLAAADQALQVQH